MLTHREALVAELHALSALVSSGAYSSKRRTQIRDRIEEILAYLYGDTDA